ncbi:hypothetical protein FraQA3DRAFT_2345 [Frankia sp. QA3]|nr:hypothetical protein FraQA3DRAFT_2345 [Frankia sp. QA3]
MSAPRSRRVRWLLVALSALTAMVVAVTGRVLFVVGDGSPDDVGVVRGELSFLGSALDHGAGERMQRLFPEGYFFSNVLYGLALTDLAAGGHGDPGKARAEAARVLGRLASPAGTAVFERGLSPEYGVFYAGWSLLLRAQSAALAARGGGDLAVPAGWPPSASGGGLPGGERAGLAAADRMAEAVRAALDAGASPFLPAYPGRS